MTDWHKKTVSEIADELGTDPENGLTETEAGLRLSRFGPNVLKQAKRPSLAIRFLSQFAEFITAVLVAAALVAGVMGEWTDSLAIMAIVLLNGVMGFVQEEKAARVIDELKKLSTPCAKAVRDGNAAVVRATALVPGDLILLEPGDFVPADCRVVESKALRTDESSLTGESAPMDKTAVAMTGDPPIAERSNMLWLGTKMVYGRGRAIVTSTGMTTEMGAIARMLSGIKVEPTPLQRRLKDFGGLLVYGALFICAVIFVMGLVRGGDVLQMFLTAVSLAVAAIPEGLPAVVTITLALGVQRMARRHALVRKLHSVETLGCATIIASDKTGTLTENRMAVKKIFLPGDEGVVIVKDYGGATALFLSQANEPLEALSHPPLVKTLSAALLCNGARLKHDERGGLGIVGDPTEGALLILAEKAGLKRDSLLERFSLVHETPFDSERKIMTCIYEDEETGRYIAFIKGAPERILNLSSCILTKDGPKPIPDAGPMLAENDSLAKDGLRVVGLAMRELGELPDISSIAEIEKDLVFLGIAGMSDPLRPEAPDAVKKAKKAGIVPLMITGDHKLTAIAIAKEAGIYEDGDLAITGEELDRMTDEEFSATIGRIKVYARVSPAHKLRIIKAWRGKGEIIAMTGDGVNDAPALKEADIGVAMGITGTDAAKEASDMILTDDNFASIVSAVEEGRGVFENIRKAVHFLLSCNIGEILVLFIASLAGMPLPLLPVQILWTNLVTDGLPALGLAMEPNKKDLMESMPREKTEGIITGPLIRLMLMQGAFIALCTLFVYGLGLYYMHSGIDKARTMAFMVLVFCQNFHIFNCRDMKMSVFKTGLFSNKLLNLAVITILAGQFSVVYIPALRPVFKTTPLGGLDWAIIFSVSMLPLALMEAIKRTRS